MVLSIGMIVKNEEKYLEKCLTALKPILDELDSELIIADTGSTDNTVEIAKKFTDNVFHFDWINDFAAARNSTLERSKGEWFMFIDADEILQNCADIIRFFKSGECKKYRSATYVVRSYSDLSDMSNFSDIRSQRMVLKAAGIKFQGAVHETFTAFEPPVKFLDIIADHYGYIFLDNGKTTDLAREKNERNLNYLFHELEDEQILERNPLIYDEIADCYNIVGDFEHEREYVNLGLERVDHKNIGITTYYTHKIITLYRQDEYKEIIETVSEYFDPQSNPSHTTELASDCYMYFTRGYAYYKLKKYKDTISDFVSFFNLYKKYTQGKLNTQDLMLGNFMIDLPIIKTSYDIFFRCCYKEKKFGIADDYSRDIPLETYFDDHSFMENHLKIRVEIMENVGYKKLDSLYRQLDEFGKSYLLTLIRQKIFETSSENRSTIVKKLALFNGLPSELAEIYKDYFENAGADFNAIKSILETHGSENGEDMLYILLDSQLDITPFLLAKDFFADRAVQILITYYPNGVSLFENYDTTNVSKEGLAKLTILYGWVMLRALNNNHEISKLFETYGSLGLKWYNESDNKTALPGDIRAALLVNNVASARKAGNRNRFMNAVRELKGVVEDLIPLADAYKEENKDAFNNSGAGPEFAQLAARAKQNIRDMINNGNTADARALLSELEGMCPDDPEIKALKTEINNTLQ